MRWPGTIQPSRFLSHTGHVMPGVRRVVQVPTPAAGQDWLVTVPGGVQWRILSGVCTLTIQAGGTSFIASAQCSVDGVVVSRYVSLSEPAVPSTNVFPVTACSGLATYYSTYGNVELVFPGEVLPEGATFGTGGTSSGDLVAWSGISVWVEEYYFTDAQLSEDARLHAELERDIAVYEYEQAQQTQGGA